MGGGRQAGIEGWVGGGKQAGIEGWIQDTRYKMVY